MRCVCMAIVTVFAVLVFCPAWAGQDMMRTGLLADLPTYKTFTVGRESSFDPSGGNADGRHDWPVEPGETREIANIEGAGAITHIWITIASKDERHLKNLVLRMYWDGEKHPSVESPIGDFFGLGNNTYYQYSSLPIQIGTDKGLNCFWRMPFSDGARVTVTNDGPVATTSFYYYIDYQKYDRLPKDVGRFHAQYRQEFPCVAGRSYLLLDAVGKGHYVGCNLSIHNREGAWWGEGDDMFYIDGAENPQLHGTGAEDYFCGAWAYGEPFSNAYFGCPQIDGKHTRNALWNVYRYHLEDPVPFTKSIKVTIEHGHANNRHDDYSSVTYWYQNEPHVPFPALPAAADRMFTEATTFTQDWTWEAERMAPAFRDERVVKESTLEHGNFWSHGYHLLFKADEPTTFTLKLPATPGNRVKYKMKFWYTAGPNYGRCEIWYNGQKAVEWDGYNADGLIRKMVESTEPVQVLGMSNVLEMRVVGKNEASSGYWVGWDCTSVP